jgi:phosphonate dehydrogenase
MNAQEAAQPRVVVTQRIHPEIANLLRSGCQPVLNHSTEPLPPAELLRRTQDAQGIIVFMPDSIDDAFLAACPALKIVAAALKGYDNFDIAACTRRGIWFTIVPDLLTEPTAELALALLLGLARNIPAGDRLIRGGAYQGWRPILYGTGLAGSTVGLVGYGAVGRALASLLGPFGCRVLHFDPQSDASVPLAELLRVSDFVLPLLPLTDETLHAFGRETLAAMKRGAYLINVARGSVVDEDAVAEALESGQLAGYAADTFEMEDWARPDRPRAISQRLLSDTGRTLFTPHLGSAVANVRLDVERAAALAVLAVLRGERPPGAINSPDAV